MFGDSTIPELCRDSGIAANSGIMEILGPYIMFEDRVIYL